jgi:hypothetical protein
MNIQIEEFQKLAKDSGKIHLCIFDGKISLMIHNHGIPGVTYFLATVQNKTKIFKSIASFEKFLCKYPDFYDCEMFLSCPSVTSIQIGV